MNTLSNLDGYYIPNTLDGINTISQTVNDSSLLVDGTNQMLADIDVNNYKIKRLASPTANTDGANKLYVDNHVTGIQTYIDLQDSFKLNLTGGTLTGKLGQVLPGNNIQFGIYNTNNLGVNEINDNVIIGNRALKFANSVCYGNTIVGNNALMNLIEYGRYNVAMGYSAGGQLEIGDYNIYIGMYSGYLSKNDIGCIYIGSTSGRDDNTTGYVKSIALGSDVIVTASHQIKIGTAEETTVFDGSVNIQAPTTENNPTTKKYVDDADVLKLNKAGDTMTGVLVLKGGGSAVSPNVYTTIDAANLTNTYITFGDGTIYNDFAYLRQIGAANDIHMALDFHDDLNDGKFSLRSIQSYGTTPDNIKTFFYSSPGETQINAPLNMLTHKIINLTNGTVSTDAVNKSQLDLKTDKTYVDSSLNFKADKTYVDASLNFKADKANAIFDALTISETTGSVATATKGSLTLAHDNSGGTSSIVFKSKVNAGSDYGYIQYTDSVGAAGTEQSQLTIGVENDSGNFEDTVNFKLNGYERMKLSGNGVFSLGPLNVPFRCIKGRLCNNNTLPNNGTYFYDFQSFYLPQPVLLNTFTNGSGYIHASLTGGSGTDNGFVYFRIIDMSNPANEIVITAFNISMSRGTNVTKSWSEVMNSMNYPNPSALSPNNAPFILPEGKTYRFQVVVNRNTDDTFVATWSDCYTYMFPIDSPSYLNYYN
jgi:hypothetical protein